MNTDAFTWLIPLPSASVSNFPSDWYFLCVCVCVCKFIYHQVFLVSLAFSFWKFIFVALL